MVDLEGDVRSHGCRRGRVRRGPEDDRVVDDLVVHRNDRRAAGGRHRDTPQAVCGEPGATLVRAEVPQLGIEECLAPAGREIDSAPAQRPDGRAQRGGQPDETRQARVGRPLFEVGQVLRRHFGAPGCLRPGQSLSPAFGGHAAADVTGVGRPLRRWRVGPGTRPLTCLVRVRPGTHVRGKPGQGSPCPVFEVTDVRVGPGEHERHLVRVRPVHVVGRGSVLVMEPHDFAVASGGAVGRAFDNELIAEVSSHGRRPFLRMVPYPTCHAHRLRRMARAARPGVPNGLFSGRPAPQEVSSAAPGGGRFQTRLTGDRVVEAARLMAVQGVKRPPVVDETERLRGIVSRGDGDGYFRGATTPSVTRRPGTCCGGRPALPPRR